MGGVYGWWRSCNGFSSEIKKCPALAIIMSSSTGSLLHGLWISLHEKGLINKHYHLDIFVFSYYPYCNY
jgi:hypothetical protein